MIIKLVQIPDVNTHLIKDPSDPSEHSIILDLFLILGKFVSSSRSWNPSLLKCEK